jgi:hypothetical protein
MPHLPIDEYTKQVGQDKTYHQINDLYTSYYGAYKNPVQDSRVKPGETKVNTQISTPFVLNK